MFSTCINKLHLHLNFRMALTVLSTRLGSPSEKHHELLSPSIYTAGYRFFLSFDFPRLHCFNAIPILPRSMFPSLGLILTTVAEWMPFFPSYCVYFLTLVTILGLFSQMYLFCKFFYYFLIPKLYKKTVTIFNSFLPQLLL